MKQLIIGILMLAGYASFAQPVRISEDEINIEKQFIEAYTFSLFAEYDKAENLFLEILKNDKRNAAVYFELAKISLKKGDPEKALQNIDNAIRFEADNYYFLLFKVDLLEQNGRYQEAALLCDELIRIQKEDPDIFYRKVDNLVRIAKFEEALTTLNGLETTFGSYEELHQRKYDLLRNMGRLEEANDEIFKLHKLYPDNTEYLYMLATYQKQKGNKQLSDSLSREILKIDPSDARATLALAQNSTKDKDDVTYLQSLKPLFANTQSNLDVKIIELIPFVEKLNEKYDPAISAELIALAEILAKTHQKEAKVFSLTGDIYNLSNNHAEAIKAYKSALAIDKSTFTVWEQLMELQFITRDANGLFNTTENALDLFPNKISVWIMNARAYSMLGKFKEARSGYEQALAMSGQNMRLRQEIHAQIGSTYFQEGNTAAAEKEFDAARKIQNLPPELTVLHADHLILGKINIPKADTLIKAALVNYPGHPLLLAGKARIELSKQQLDKAKLSLEQSIDNGAENVSTVQELYGDVLFKLNQTDTAIIHWEKSLQLNPYNETLKKKIKDKQWYE
jgi:tetratricopeptide (TPR) repeat protein